MSTQKEPTPADEHKELREILGETCRAYADRDAVFSERVAVLKLGVSRVAQHVAACVARETAQVANRSNDIEEENVRLRCNVASSRAEVSRQREALERDILHVLRALAQSGSKTHDHYVLMARRLIDESILPALSPAPAEVSPRADEGTPTPRTNANEQSVKGPNAWSPHAVGAVPASYARKLERENADLRRDKERLDWTEQDSSEPRVTRLIKVYWRARNRTLREAIDALAGRKEDAT